MVLKPLCEAPIPSPELLSFLYAPIPLICPGVPALCGCPQGTPWPIARRLEPQSAGRAYRHRLGAEPAPGWARSSVPRQPAEIRHPGAHLPVPESCPGHPTTLRCPSTCPPVPQKQVRAGMERVGSCPGARRSTLAAGSALQDDDRRPVQPLGAAAGGAQLAQVGVGVGVAAAHRLAAGAHTEAGLRAPPHRGRGWHPEGHHALQTLAARALLQAARGALGRAAHLAAAARVPGPAALAVLRLRRAARRLAAVWAPGGQRRRAAGPGQLRRGGRRQQQQQQREKSGARDLHGDSGGGGGGGGQGEGRRAAPGRVQEGLGGSGCECARPRGPAHWPRSGDEPPWGRARRPGWGLAGWREGGRLDRDRPRRGQGGRARARRCWRGAGGAARRPALSRDSVSPSARPTYSPSAGSLAEIRVLQTNGTLQGGPAAASRGSARESSCKSPDWGPAREARTGPGRDCRGLCADPGRCGTADPGHALVLPPVPRTRDPDRGACAAGRRQRPRSWQKARAQTHSEVIKAESRSNSNRILHTSDSLKKLLWVACVSVFAESLGSGSAARNWRGWRGLGWERGFPLFGFFTKCVIISKHLLSKI